MKKLLLTSMLCFCMLMQGCTISESDTVEDKIVNIDGSIECSWGMSAEDIKSKEKAELTGEEEYFNTYSLGYNAGSTTDSQTIHYAFEDEKLVGIFTLYTYGKFENSPYNILEVFNDKYDKLVEKYGQPVKSVGDYLVEDSEGRRYVWWNAEEGEPLEKNKWLDYIDTLHVAYIWYSDDTAIGLTLLDKFDACLGYCNISSNMYQIDNPDVLFLNAGIGNTDYLSSINESGKEQYSNTK